MRGGYLRERGRDGLVSLGCASKDLGCNSGDHVDPLRLGNRGGPWKERDATDIRYGHTARGVTSSRSALLETAAIPG